MSETANVKKTKIAGVVRGFFAVGLAIMVCLCIWHCATYLCLSVGRVWLLVRAAVGRETFATLKSGFLANRVSEWVQQSTKNYCCAEVSIAGTKSIGTVAGYHMPVSMSQISAGQCEPRLPAEAILSRGRGPPKAAGAEETYRKEDTMDDIPLYKPEETYDGIRATIISAKYRVSVAVNTIMVGAYWEIGKQIYYACGENDRAEYGKRMLKYLSEKLVAEFGKGFSETNLRYMRKFYCMFPDYSMLNDKLSWSHYRLLMRIQDDKARAFYAEESAEGNLSARELERQIHTMSYERLLANHGTALPIELEPLAERSLKDPYMMEFLGLSEDDFVANEFEKAVYEHLHEFTKELGSDFEFSKKQAKIVISGRTYRVDLVFRNIKYNYKLLIDLKSGALTPRDVGQMQFYVNYYTRRATAEGENPPIGLLLCKSKDDTVVRYTLPEGYKQIYVAKYFTSMPTEEELRRWLSWMTSRRGICCRPDALGRNRSNLT